VLCRQQVVEIVQNKSEFANEDIRLAVIGSDETQYFKEFRRVTGYSGLLLSDPSRLAFAILGFASGIAGLLSLHGLSRTLLAIKDGIRPGALHGSALQLGGVVIVEPSNHVRYYFASKKAGDHPAMQTFLQLFRLEKRRTQVFRSKALNLFLNEVFDAW
jgi:hypothetical protein